MTGEKDDFFFDALSAPEPNLETSVTTTVPVLVSISNMSPDPPTPKPPSKKRAKRSKETDYLQDWSKGRDVSSWAQHKVSAAREAKQLKEKQKREDERRAAKMFATLDGSEREEFLMDIGADDIVFQKLFDQGGRGESVESDSDATMDDL